MASPLTNEELTPIEVIPLGTEKNLHGEQRKKKGKNGKDDLPSDNGVLDNGTTCKGPLYDELSIPFIDASPAPSMKLGRSTDRDSIEMAAKTTEPEIVEMQDLRTNPKETDSVINDKEEINIQNKSVFQGINTCFDKVSQWPPIRFIRRVLPLILSVWMYIDMILDGIQSDTYFKYSFVQNTTFKRWSFEKYINDTCGLIRAGEFNELPSNESDVFDRIAFFCGRPMIHIEDEVKKLQDLTKEACNNTYSNNSWISETKANNSGALNHDKHCSAQVIPESISKYYFYFAILTWIGAPTFYTLFSYWLAHCYDKSAWKYGWFGNPNFKESFSGLYPVLYLSFTQFVDSPPKCVRVFLIFVFFPLLNFLVSVAVVYILLPIGSLWISLRILFLGDDFEQDEVVYLVGIPVVPNHMSEFKLSEQLGEAAPQIILCVTFYINNYQFIHTHDLIPGTPVPKTLVSVVFSFGSLMLGVVMGGKLLWQDCLKIRWNTYQLNGANSWM